MGRYEKVKKILKDKDQEQLLVCYDKLDSKGKEKLLDQIEHIDFDLVKKLYKSTKEKPDFSNDKIEPIDYVDKSKLSPEQYDEFKKIGEEEIRNNKLAVLTMAGGQGTRLGCEGPKGTFDIGLPSHESIFELLSNPLKEANKKYGIVIPWYIMTSNENNEETKSFFEKHNFFGYPSKEVIFFVQGQLPMVGQDGKILVNEDGYVKLAADGHGGVFQSMLKDGILQDMNNRKLEWVFIGPVDNPLVNMVDPVFLGFAKKNKCMAAGKSVVKARPDERVGVFCKRNGKPSVVEYTEISEEMSHKRDKNGELVFGESHINCNLFNINRINEVAANKLPYHEAFKKANYIDSNGRLVKADKPNAYKFESFIFDAFQSMESMGVMRVKREDEFAPVKNKEGLDSPETARKLYQNFQNKMKNNANKSTNKENKNNRTML